ncbi:hypothetical protein K438DRAFT_1854767 [Mycena galopus ATCC 62051]|nr:hypothetical protein K438DRAFT_1854767 [Mycena galopus ATCC 62051]
MDTRRKDERKNVNGAQLVVHSRPVAAPTFGRASLVLLFDPLPPTSPRAWKLGPGPSRGRARTGHRAQPAGRILILLLPDIAVVILFILDVPGRATPFFGAATRSTAAALFVATRFTVTLAAAIRTSARIHQQARETSCRKRAGPASTPAASNLPSSPSWPRKLVLDLQRHRRLRRRRSQLLRKIYVKEYISAPTGRDGHRQAAVDQ